MNDLKLLEEVISHMDKKSLVLVYAMVNRYMLVMLLQELKDEDKKVN